MATTTASAKSVPAPTPVPEPPDYWRDKIIALEVSVNEALAGVTLPPGAKEKITKAFDDALANAVEKQAPHISEVSTFQHGEIVRPTVKPFRTEKLPPAKPAPAPAVFAHGQDPRVNPQAYTNPAKQPHSPHSPHSPPGAHAAKPAGAHKEMAGGK